MSSLDALDAQSQAQLHAVIQQAVQEGLAATEQRLAQSEAQWIFVNDSLADPIQKRLAHYFESGDRRNWSSGDFIAYLDTLYADDTTVGEARYLLSSAAALFSG
ncbi:hypothetical protein E4U52_005401 [Claviceps spartinae]|nr:hypothetical protein E4U52_005401 [Claviceps spartinae]